MARAGGTVVRLGDRVPSDLPTAALWWGEHQSYEVFSLQERGKKPRSNREVRAVGWPDSEPPGDGRGGFHLATRDPGVIRLLWETWPRANIGCAVPPRRVILDLDSSEALELLAALDLGLPTTATVLTHRGRHLHYCLPDDIKLQQVDLGQALRAAHARGESWGLEEIPPAARAVELRTAGAGYGILPPSVHPSGTVYRVEGGRWPAVTEAPAWLLQLFDRRHFERLRENGGLTSSGLDLEEILTGIPRGRRDDALFRYASRLRALGLSFAEAELLLRAAWEKAEQPPGDRYPWKEARRKLDQAWKYAAGTRRPCSRWEEGPAERAPSAVAPGVAGGDAPDAADRAGFRELYPLAGPVDLPPFPLEALPPVLGDLVSEVAESVQTPVALPALLALGALSAAGSHVRLWVQAGPLAPEPACLYLAPVLGPSERKSSAFRYLVAPLEAFEAGLRQRHAQETVGTRELRAAEEANLRRLRREAADAATDGERKRLVAEIERLTGEMTAAAPPEPCLLAADITQEGLAVRLQEQGGRLAIFDTEGAVFSVALGRYASGLANFESLLRGWSADALRVDRKGSAPIRVQRPMVTVCVPIQPEVLRQLGEKRETVTLGLMSRFLYALPASRVGWRKLPDRPVSETVQGRYNAALERLLQLPTPPLACPATAEGRVLQLEGEALECWKAFYNTTERSMGPGGELAAIADWGGKLPGSVARIAGLLHAVEAPGEPWDESIRPQAVERAVQMGEYFKPHALAAYQVLGANPELALALRAWEMVKRQQWSTFSPRDLYRALGLSAQEVKPAIEILLDRGYIRTLPPELRPPGARGPAPSHRFEVRPEALSPPSTA